MSVSHYAAQREGESEEWGWDRPSFDHRPSGGERKSAAAGRIALVPMSSPLPPYDNPDRVALRKTYRNAYGR